jgi:hypothetical protein
VITPASLEFCRRALFETQKLLFAPRKIQLESDQTVAATAVQTLAPQQGGL